MSRRPRAPQAARAPSILTSRLPQRVAMVATFLMGLATCAFAITRSYVLALLFLVVAGVANLVSMSVGQTVVQLEAPPNERGSVVGVYAMSSGGLRAGSGLTVGMLGILSGIRWSLALSAAALCLSTLLTAALTSRNRDRHGEPPVREPIAETGRLAADTPTPGNAR